jgi:cytochrome c-type biogenesis protein CcmH/NrfF
LLVVLGAVSVSAQPPATNVDDPRLYEVAAQLRCVVCQNLSVADSPSEMAQQMRLIIRERLAAGQSSAQITQYFVDKYGEWILLSPRRSGFNLLVWGVPIAAIAVGLIVFALQLRRWTSLKRAGVDAVDRGRRPERRGQTRHWKEVKHEAKTDDPGDVFRRRLHGGTGRTSARTGASPCPAADEVLIRVTTSSLGPGGGPESKSRGHGG